MATPGIPKFSIDIWRRIFEHANEAEEARRLVLADPASPLYVDPHAPRYELDSPRCFPHSVAAAGLCFQAILMAMPSVWRRILIYLEDESPATALLGHIARLERSGLKPTEIVVTRKNWAALSAASTPPDPREEDKVKDIMNVLHEQLPHLTSLTIRTISGNSLPCITDFSMAQLPQLQTLVLDSVIRGTGRVQRTRTQSEPIESVHLPMLSHLALTGPNLVTICRDGAWKTWYEGRRKLKQYPSTKFDVLRISHFDEVDGRDTSKYPSFTLQDFFRHVLEAQTRELQLCDVSYGNYSLDPRAMDVEQFTYLSLTMENVSWNVIRCYLESISTVSFEPEDYTDGIVPWTHKFINCDFGTPSKWEAFKECIAIPGESLVLARMPCPESVKLCLGLASETVGSLWVSDSPGFGESVIRRLAKADGGSRLLPNLRAIHLEDCPHISLGLLKDLAEELNGEADVDLQRIQLVFI
ncbi:hypothetical protein NMY22_g2586 [Coprinellus aureogranulatus]|nr:hypothetical protein NMY22_g2586 [Coprinellus aureogranulatus]